MKAVKQSGYRTIVMSMETPVLELPLVAAAAVDAGLTNGDYFWLFFGDYDVSQWFSTDENVRALQRGSQWISPLDPFLVDSKSDPFLNAWKKQGQQAAVDVIFANPLGPGQPGYFLTDENYYQENIPEFGSSFIYDSVMSTGIGACYALAAQRNSNVTGVGESDEPIGVADKGKPKPLVTSDLHVRGIRASQFTGASRTVRFGGAVGQRNPAARDSESIIWAVFNLLSPSPATNDEQPAYFEIPRLHFDREWYPFGPGEFVYSDGRTSPPELLRDPPEMNYLSVYLRATGFLLLGIALVSVLACCGWTYLRRSTKLVRAAQPTFLYLICLGAATSVCAIVTISFDEGSGVSAAHLGRMCMSAPWLLSLGHIITYGSLFSKLWRINRVLQFSRRKIEVKHVAWPVAAVFGVALILLALWTGLDPMRWNRYELNVETGEMIGECSSDYLSAWLVPLVALMLIPTVLTLLMAWKTKDVDEAYTESKWIFIMVAVQLEVILVSIPLIAILRGVSTDGRYMGFAFLIWMFPMSALGFLFIPKIHAHRKSLRGDAGVSRSKRGARQSGANVHVSGLNGALGPTGYSSTISSRYGLGTSVVSNDSARRLTSQGPSFRGLDTNSSFHSRGHVTPDDDANVSRALADRNSTLPPAFSDIPDENDENDLTEHQPEQPINAKLKGNIFNMQDEFDDEAT
jgi:7 transmembrane sweet-taste receptor of 3 GCPR